MAATGSTPTLSANLLLLVVVAVITVGSVVAVGTTTALDDVCGGLGGYYVTPELCVSTLCPPDPSSSSPSSSCRAARDAPAVAAIAARLAAANATAAKDSVEAALSSYATAAGDNAAATEALRSCLRLYGGVVPALQWAARSVAAGRFRGAREVMLAARYVPAGCDGMADGGRVALPSQNDGFAMVATVAHAVLASLSKGY